jgi:hypothetical protein
MRCAIDGVLQVRTRSRKAFRSRPWGLRCCTGLASTSHSTPKFGKCYMEPGPGADGIVILPPEGYYEVISPSHDLHLSNHCGMLQPFCLRFLPFMPPLQPVKATLWGRLHSGTKSAWRPTGGPLEAYWRPTGGLLETHWKPIGTLRGQLCCKKNSHSRSNSHWTVLVKIFPYSEFIHRRFVEGSSNSSLHTRRGTYRVVNCDDWPP